MVKTARSPRRLSLEDLLSVHWVDVCRRAIYGVRAAVLPKSPICTDQHRQDNNAMRPSRNRPLRPVQLMNATCNCLERTKAFLFSNSGALQPKPQTIADYQYIHHLLYVLVLRKFAWTNVVIKRPATPLFDLPSSLVNCYWYFFYCATSR
jgi:hypothetical protein